jgi:hypothetical protein
VHEQKVEPAFDPKHGEAKPNAAEAPGGFCREITNRDAPSWRALCARVGFQERVERRKLKP